MQSSTKAVKIDNFCWIPDTQINVRALRSALSYGNNPSEAIISDGYVRIPKFFFKKARLNRFPKVEYVSREWESNPIPTKNGLRPYQEDPYSKMVESGGGILNLGCGYGKTFLSLYYIAKKGVKAAVVLGNTSLIEQWKNEALNHLDITEDDIGIVRGNKWQHEGKKIVLISLATLARRSKESKIPKGFCEQFGVVFYDECHHLSAPMFSQTCGLFYGERHGLTATPAREDGLERVFFNHLGPIYYSKTDQDIVPDCVFVTTTVNADEAIEQDLVTSYKERRILDRSGEIHHRKLCAWLGQLECRNSAIIDIVNQEVANGRKVLCITHSVEHAKHMNETYSRPSGLAIGDIPSNERVQVIRKNKVSWATVDIAAEALDAPELSCLVVMTPFGARTQGNLLQQALGRIQRKYKDKIDAVFYFIHDQDIGICRGLGWQVKKKLHQWEYPVREVSFDSFGKNT